MLRIQAFLVARQSSRVIEFQYLSSDGSYYMFTLCKSLVWLLKCCMDPNVMFIKFHVLETDLLHFDKQV
jgi:hypothetical protein